MIGTQRALLCVLIYSNELGSTLQIDTFDVCSGRVKRMQHSSVAACSQQTSLSNTLLALNRGYHSSLGTEQSTEGTTLLDDSTLGDRSKTRVQHL